MRTQAPCSWGLLRPEKRADTLGQKWGLSQREALQLGWQEGVAPSGDWGWFREGEAVSMGGTAGAKETRGSKT